MKTTSPVQCSATKHMVHKAPREKIRKKHRRFSAQFVLCQCCQVALNGKAAGSSSPLATEQITNTPNLLRMYSLVGRLGVLDTRAHTWRSAGQKTYFHQQEEQQQQQEQQWSEFHGRATS